MANAKTTNSGKPYASRTKITATQSLEQIKADLRRFGATGFAQAEDDTRVALMFVLGKQGSPDERRVRFTMYLPSKEDQRFTHTKVNSSSALYRRSPAETEKLWDAEIMRLWRALALGIKGKLILVEEGIETIEEAFYAHVVTPSGHTIYEESHLAIAEAYRTGIMPRQLILDVPQDTRLLEGRQG